MAEPVRVTGHLDGVVYTVEVTGAGPRPVVGSKRVAALVTTNLGRRVNVTPTGPSVVVKTTDIASLLALLDEKTKVTDVAGEASLIGARRYGAVG